MASPFCVSGQALPSVRGARTAGCANRRRSVLPDPCPEPACGSAVTGVTACTLATYERRIHVYAYATSTSITLGQLATGIACMLDRTYM